MNEALGFGSAPSRSNDPDLRLLSASTCVSIGCMPGPESSLSLNDDRSGEGARDLGTGSPVPVPTQVKLSLLGFLRRKEGSESVSTRRPPDIVLGLSDDLSDNVCGV